MPEGPLKIGITCGDPAGIGPEVSLRAAGLLKNPNIIPILIGRKELLERLYPGLVRGFNMVDDLSGAECGKKYIYDVKSDLPVPEPGRGNPTTGLESKSYMDAAIGFWLDGGIDALVTAPVSKEMIEKSGTPFTGHTEYIAFRTGKEKPYMMMYSERYRVILATTHMPLSDVPGNIDAGRILDVIRAGSRAVESIDGKKARIAVAGLDPHCGDGGAIGDFDSRVTAEAVKRARDEGIDAEGPVSADALFIPGRWSGYSLAVAQYHDQGLIPFKVLSFESGVNVTVGLSITRTSPDHGTAYDIAGKGVADCTSMIEAVNLAFRLETVKRRSGGGL
ncbi:MAG: 4-hydroxythreonine-4-phosphate dehydrogenase PdxA [Spirochaetes bacterium]|nr:4-hydroxythreonine-4-phosphate dehydrogenase PdxA [Spirochaetota bacterium]